MVIVRKTLHRILIFILFIALVGGCGKDDASTDSIAPKKIEGKQLLFGGDTYKIYGFASNGICKIPEGTVSGVTTDIRNTPRYTYQKLDSKTSSFRCNYKTRVSSRTSYAYYDVSFSLTLTFTSSTSGTLSGTAYFVKTSGNNGRSSHYNFKNKAFTLK